MQKSVSDTTPSKSNVCFLFRVKDLQESGLSKCIVDPDGDINRRKALESMNLSRFNEKSIPPINRKLDYKHGVYSREV